jgi:hypothetical protein
VGPPGNGVWPVVAPPTGGQVTLTTPLLENVRWLPYMNWVGAQDELVPYIGPVAQQNRFDELGLRSELWTFQSDHFGLAVLDRWEDARDFLGDARARRDPPRVNYAFFPESDNTALGLRHDHAYWVSGLRARDATGNPATAPARAEIDARSLTSGEGDPTSEDFTRADDGPPAPAAVRGTRWTGAPAAKAENALEVTLDNVSNAVLDGRRAKLDGGRSLRVKVTSDGPGEMRLDLPFPAGVQARLAQASDVSLSSSGATIRYGAGSIT